MSLPSNSGTTDTTATTATMTFESAHVLEVLEQVRGPFHPGTRLFAAHRRDIAAALAAAGITGDTTAHACIALTLATAETYEADGMYAFLPTWDLLMTRVARLDAPTSASEA